MFDMMIKVQPLFQTNKLIENKFKLDMLGIVVENYLQVHLTLPLVVLAHISPPECSFEVCVARLKLLLRPEPTAMVGVALGLLPLQELRHMDL